MNPFTGLDRRFGARIADATQRSFELGSRDYASLRLNYHRMHGEPMPGGLQREIIALRNDVEAAHGK